MGDLLALPSGGREGGERQVGRWLDEAEQAGALRVSVWLRTVWSGDRSVESDWRSARDQALGSDRLDARSFNMSFHTSFVSSFPSCMYMPCRAAWQFRLVAVHLRFCG